MITEKQFLTAKETADLLNINEKKLYVLAQEGQIPATKITGKWLFPAKELEDHLTQDAFRNCVIQKSLELHQVILISGSNDPLINYACNQFNAENDNMNIFLSNVGSGAGLSMLNTNKCHIALSHMHDYDNNTYNFSMIERIFGSSSDIVVINIFKRNIGFVSKSEVRSLQDTVSGKLKFINRQINSGIRNMVEHLLQTEQLQSDQLIGYETEVMTHQEVAMAVSDGSADVGVCAESAAKQFNLPFYPIEKERFDMVLRKDLFFEENIQTLINYFKSEAFNSYAAGLDGYDLSMNGQIVYG